MNHIIPNVAKIKADKIARFSSYLAASKIAAHERRLRGNENDFRYTLYVHMWLATTVVRLEGPWQNGRGGGGTKRVGGRKRLAVRL